MVSLLRRDDRRKSRQWEVDTWETTTCLSLLAKPSEDHILTEPGWSGTRSNLR